MEKIWIIGVGRFGQIAFRRLSEAGRNRRFVLVDPVAENLRQCKSATARHETSDGIKFLEKNLTGGSSPDWIIPALPVHLAAEWFLLNLGPSKLKRLQLPSELDGMLPNPTCGAEGNMYVSHADFRCPEDCDEPRDICSITHKTRHQNMYDLLLNLALKPFNSLNMRSYQLGPGIGGYRAEHLLEMKATIEQATGPVLLSTACRCHGVITALERI